MPVNSTHRTKARSVELVMKNPQLRRMIKDAWDAPIGSTRREGAKHVVSIMTKLHGAQDAPGVSHMEEDPWAHLPVHRPVLNYATHIPKAGQASPADGQGGPGPSENGLIGDAWNWFKGTAVPAVSKANDAIGNFMTHTVPSAVANTAVDAGAAGVEALKAAEGAALTGRAWYDENVDKQKQLWLGTKSVPTVRTMESSPYMKAANYLDKANDPAANRLFDRYGNVIKSLAQVNPPKNNASTASGANQVKNPNQNVTAPTAPALTSKTTTPEDHATAINKFSTVFGQSGAKDWSAAMEKNFQSGASWEDNWNLVRKNTPASISDEDINNFLDQKWNTGKKTQETQTATGNNTGTSTYGPSLDSFPNISAGMSGAQGSTNEASGNGPSTYTTNTQSSPTSGTSSVLSKYDLNSIPGLDINSPENSGLTQTAYEQKALQTISQMDDEKWNAEFPGIPKPQGVSLSGQIDALIQAKRKDLGLDDLLKQRTEMLNSNPTFVEDARDYIVQHDEQMRQIDSMLSDVSSMPTSDDPTARALMDSYSSYLNIMKGKTAQRYATYLNKAVDVRTQEATKLDNEIAQAQQELQMAIPTIQAKATEDFTTVMKIIQENAQKPALAAKMAAEAAKSRNYAIDESLKQMKAMVDLSKARETSSEDFQKEVTSFTNFVTDPNTGGWNLSMLDLPKLVEQYNKDPFVVLASMQKLMPASIDSMKANRISNKATVGGLTSTLDMFNSYESSIKGLNDAITSKILQTQSQNPQDPSLSTLFASRGRLADVQAQLTRSSTALFGDELSKAWTGLSPVLNTLAGNAGGWFGWGKKSAANFSSPEEKNKWVSEAAAKTRLDKEVVSTIWDMLASNIKQGGDPNLIKTYTPSSLAYDLASYYEAVTGVYSSYDPSQGNIDPLIQSLKAGQ